MSTPSSSPDAEIEGAAVDEDDDVDVDEVDDVRDDARSLTLHWSSLSIICTSLERSRTCDEQHCMRELVWRCILRIDVATREYVGLGRYAVGEAQSSLGGDKGPQERVSRAVSIRSDCWLSWTARSPIVQGGVVAREGSWNAALGLEVGDTFIAARSAS
jgi:hypothetical protein